MRKKEIKEPIYIRIYEGDEDIIEKIEKWRRNGRYKSNSRIVKQMIREV